MVVALKRGLTRFRNVSHTGDTQSGGTPAQVILSPKPKTGSLMIGILSTRGGEAHTISEAYDTISGRNWSVIGRFNIDQGNPSARREISLFLSLAQANQETEIRLDAHVSDSNVASVVVIEPSTSYEFEFDQIVNNNGIGVTSVKIGTLPIRDPDSLVMGIGVWRKEATTLPENVAFSLLHDTTLSETDAGSDIHGMYHAVELFQEGRPPGGHISELTYDQSACECSGFLLSFRNRLPKVDPVWIPDPPKFPTPAIVGVSKKLSGPPREPFSLNRESPQSQNLKMWFPIIGDQNVGSIYDRSGYGYRADRVGAAKVELLSAAGFNAVKGDGDQDRYTVAGTGGFFDGLSAGTLTGWAFPTSAQTARPEVFWGSDQNFMLLVDAIAVANRGSLVIKVGGTLYGTGPHTVNANEIIFMCGTYDGETSRTYHNGLEVGSNGAMSGVLSNETGGVAINGSSYLQNGIDHIGSCWDCRFYDRVLSPSEIWEMYDPETRFDLFWQRKRHYYPVQLKFENEIRATNIISKRAS